MSAGTSQAMAIVRVPRGAAQPAQEKLRQALDKDRGFLRLPPGDARNELIVTGPFPVLVGTEELDEYVVWER
jgi:hypothetical protein